MNCARCTEKRILKDHEVSKRGKEESRGKDAGMFEDEREEKRTQRRKKWKVKGKKGQRERGRENANKRSRICVEMRGSEG